MADSSTRRPRRALLTREAVVEAAARVLAREGYEGLTMRAIAEDLRVQAPAIYWYVKSKKALEVALYDHLMAGFAFTLAGDDWAGHVRQAAHQLRAHLRSQRDIARLVPFDYAMGPTSLAQFEAALAILRAGGLGPKDAAYAFNLLFAYVVDWASGETDLMHRRLTAPDADRVDPETLGALEAAAYPNVAALAQYLSMDDIDGRFDFGLDCMIAGLERLRAAT